MLTFDRAIEDSPLVGCVLDSEGCILRVSKGWKDLADDNGLRLPGHGVGQNYLSHCVHSDGSLELFRGLKAVLARKLLLFSSLYSCPSADDPNRWCSLIAFASVQGSAACTLVHVNVSALVEGGLVIPASTATAPQEPEKLLSVVRQTIREELAGQRQSQPTTDTAAHAALQRLTKRQQEMLGLLATGASNLEIAEAFGLALSSVKTQMARIVKKLGCENRTQAAILASKIGIPNQL